MAKAAGNKLTHCSIHEAKKLFKQINFKIAFTAAAAHIFLALFKHFCDAFSNKLSSNFEHIPWKPNSSQWRHSN